MKRLASYLTKTSFCYFIVFLFGSLSGLSFGHFYYLPLLFISFFILLKILYQENISSKPWRAFFIGYFFSLGQFIVNLAWISNAVLLFPEFYWMLPFSYVGLPAILAAFSASACLLFAYFKRYSDYGALFILIAAWGFFEWFRGNLFNTGFPWNYIGHIWGDNLSLLQTTSVIGLLGLSLLTVALLCLPYCLYRYKNRYSLIFPSTILSLFIGFYLWGGKRVETSITFYDHFTVTLVQPNIPQHLKWNRDVQEQNFLIHTSLSQEVTKKHKNKTLIIWPESASTFYLSHNQHKVDQIGQTLNPNQYILTGAPRAEISIEDPTKIIKKNSIYLIDHNGNVVDVYDKFQLVPFGEYIPLKFLFSWLPLLSDADGFARGIGLKSISLPGIPSFSPLICYEVIFSAEVASDKDRPNWMVNITNDAWYGDSPGPYQHYDIAKIRAIEEGIPLVRVANTGLSGIVSPYGKTIVKTALNTRQVIEHSLPKPLKEPTFFSKNNHLIFLVLIMAFIVSALLIKKYNISLFKD